MVGFFLLASCEGQKEHTAPAVHDRDSASMMISYGVNTLISDSGVIKYRIVTERWEVNTVSNPSRYSGIRLRMNSIRTSLHVWSHRTVRWRERIFAAMNA